MTWISNQWNNFISNMNGTASIPNELGHILSMIGTRSTDEKRIIIHGLQIISVKELTRIVKNEWIGICTESGMRKERAERLWNELKAFKAYYFEQRRDRGSQYLFNASSYNEYIHNQQLDDILHTNTKPTPIEHQVKFNSTDETISPINSNEEEIQPLINKKRERFPVSDKKKSEVFPQHPDNSSNTVDDPLLAAILSTSPGTDTDTTSRILHVITSTEKPTNDQSSTQINKSNSKARDNVNNHPMVNQGIDSKIQEDIKLQIKS